MYCWFEIVAYYIGSFWGNSFGWMRVKCETDENIENMITKQIYGVKASTTRIIRGRRQF